jgi:hypothetical protein
MSTPPNLLSAPVLYQEDATTSTADLSNIAPGIDLIVTTFPAGANVHDTVAVYFGNNKVAEAKVTINSPHNFDVPVKLTDVPLRISDVTYRVNGGGASNAQRVTFIRSQPANGAGARPYRVLLQGAYIPGMLAQWIVGADGQLAASSLLMRALSATASGTGTTIELSRVPLGGDGAPFGTFSFDGAAWVFSSSYPALAVKRGDILSLSLQGSITRTIGLELAI